MNKVLFVLVLLTVAFGVGRFFVPTMIDTSPTAFYKDAAHLFVGGLFGAAFAAKTKGLSDFGNLVLFLAVALTVVEVVAVFVS